MPRGHQLTAIVFPGTDPIPGGLLLQRRHLHLDDLVQPQQPSQINASHASVFTRSPAGRCSFDGAATTHLIPAASNRRASANPVGPTSYVTAAGCGNAPTHDATPAGSYPNRRRITSQVRSSIGAATTLRACRSSPTLMR